MATVAGRHSGPRVQHRVGRAALYVILLALAAYFLMPIYVLLITGFKSYAAVNVAQMWQLPSAFNPGSFLQAWTRVGPNFVNSVLIVVPAAVLSTLIGSINGYVFAKWRFRGSEVIFLLVLFGMFVPYQGLLIPLVLTLQFLGLYGSIPGLIVTHCILGIPITAMMFRSFFSGVPNELVDAAKIDGCGFFRIFRWLMLPVAPPAVAVVLLWQFTTIWNDFLLAVVVLSNPSVAPITVAVENLAGSYSVQWNVQMAGALLAALPTMIVYLLLGKLFMRGLLAGALKG